MLTEIRVVAVNHATDQVCSVCGRAVGSKTLIRHETTGLEFVLCWTSCTIFRGGRLRISGEALTELRARVERFKKERWLARGLAKEKAEMKKVLSGPDPYDPS